MQTLYDKTSQLSPLKKKKAVKSLGLDGAASDVLAQKSFP